MRANEIVEWRDVVRFMGLFFMDAWLAEVWATNPLAPLGGKTPKEAWNDTHVGRRLLREYLKQLENPEGWFDPRNQKP